MDIENKHISRNKKTVFRVIDGQAVVLSVAEDLEKPERINIFNATGTKIWELINGERKLPEIATLLCKEYDMEYREALKEAGEFICQLHKKRLVELLDGSVN